MNNYYRISYEILNMAVEVDARDVTAESLKGDVATIGMRGQAQNKLVSDAGKKAATVLDGYTY